MKAKSKLERKFPTTIYVTRDDEGIMFAWSSLEEMRNCDSEKDGEIVCEYTLKQPNRLSVTSFLTPIAKGR